MRHLVRLSILVVLATLAALGTVAAHGGEHCRLIRGAETPDDASDDVEVCRQQQWFHQAESKAGNAVVLDGQLPTFDTTEPATSVTGGAGGGYLGSSLYQLFQEHPQAVHPAFTGSFDGPVDNALIEFFLFPPHHMALQAAGEPDGDNFRVDVWLYADGVEVASHVDLTVPLEAGGDAVKKVRFAIPDLYDALEFNGLDGKGEPYDLELRIVGTGIATNGALWVYDTTEVASSIVFNATPEELEGLPGMPWIPPGTSGNAL
ncbi:MAG: hypothetical protein KY469_19045 [Actinobacteria bacterium]|nr:hypothetical protein [Actinomycetota bacterium]